MRAVYPSGFSSKLPSPSGLVFGVLPFSVLIGHPFILEGWGGGGLAVMELSAYCKSDC